MATRLNTGLASNASNLTYAVSAGTNRRLIVGIAGEGAQTGNHTCDYGGQTGVLIGSAIAGSGATQQTVSLFAFTETQIAAASGTTISAGNVPTDYNISAMAYQDCEQGTLTNFDTDTSAGTTPNPLAALDITTVGANAIVAAMSGMGNAGSAAWASPLTEQTDQPTSSANGSAADGEIVSATTVACECTWTTQNRAAAVAVGIEHLSASGITNVTPDEFDFDNTDVDIAGINFEATQATGAIYISDASTLAGSANEVEIDGAINTWSNILVNLNFSGLSQTEIDNLHTLGPGARFIILVNDSADEYSSPITLHRPQAIEMVLSANFAPGSTTQRLTGLTGTFAGGRIEETAAQNPSTTDTNVASGGNREDVWNIQGKPNARDVSYDLRVLYGTLPAETITQTPQVTLESSLAIDVGFIASGAAVYEPTLSPGLVAIAVGFIAAAGTLYEPALGGSIQLDAGFISPTTALYEPALSPGAAILSNDFIAAGNVLYQPELNPGLVTLDSDYIASGSALYEPELSPGPVTTNIDFIAAASTLYEPILIQGGTVASIDFIASASALYQPLLSPGSVDVDVGFIASTTALYEPTVGILVPGQVDADFIASTSALYEPVLLPGSVTTTVDYISTASALYEPTVDPGAITADIDYISETTTLYEPVLSPGVVSIDVGFIASASAIYEPSINILVIGQVNPGFIGSASTLYQPTLTPGLVTADIDFIASAYAMYEPLLNPGVVATTIDFIASTVTVYEPVVFSFATIDVGFIASTSILYEPALSPGLVVAGIDFISSSAQLYEPGLGGSITADIDFISSTTALYEPLFTGSYTVEVGFISSASQLYSPVLNPGLVTIGNDFIASAYVMYEPIVLDSAFIQNYEGVSMGMKIARTHAHNYKVSKEHTDNYKISKEFINDES